MMKHNASWLCFVYVHLKRKGSHTVSHVSAFAHTCFRLTCLTHSDDTVKKRAQLFFSKNYNLRSLLAHKYLQIRI